MFAVLGEHGRACQMRLDINSIVGVNNRLVPDSVGNKIR